MELLLFMIVGHRIIRMVDAPRSADGLTRGCSACYRVQMTLEEIQQAIARLSPEERATLRAWLTQAEAGPPEPISTPEQTAEAPASETASEKFGRLAGRTFADLRKRIRET